MYACTYVLEYWSMHCVLPSPQDNPYYVKPKVSNAKFGIRHYAGEVFYDTNGLLDKNRDTFRDDILKVLKDSR